MVSTKGEIVIIDLIEINNDRVAGFEKATADIGAENFDLKEIFQRFAEQSRRYSQELTMFLGSEAESGTSVSGDLHRAWIDLKALFTGTDRASVLSEAERGEDAIKKAYQRALASEDLPIEAMESVIRHSGEITAAHNQIKALRDSVNV